MVLKRAAQFREDFNPAVVVGIKQEYRLIDPTYWLCMDDIYYDIDDENIDQIKSPKFVFDSEKARSILAEDDRLIVLETPNEGTGHFTDSEQFALDCKVSDSGVASLRLAYLYQRPS